MVNGAEGTGRGFAREGDPPPLPASLGLETSIGRDELLRIGPSL